MKSEAYQGVSSHFVRVGNTSAGKFFPSATRTECLPQTVSSAPSVTSFWARLSVFHSPPEACIPGSDALEKKFNCRPVASTLWDEKPFD